MALNTSADWVRVRTDQRNSAISLFGKDPVASSNLGYVVPYTPPDYADMVYNDWGATYHGCVKKEAQTQGNDIAVAMAEKARQGKRVLRDEELQQIEAFTSMPFTRKMTTSLRQAYQAMQGSLVVTKAGVKVLNAGSCQSFWDATSTYVINASTVKAILPEPNRWSLFLGYVQGSAEDVGDAIGRAAGKVTETAGRTLGAGLTGFLGELGPVNALIVIGAGVVAFKVF